jgi:hypothetical protein
MIRAVRWQRFEGGIMLLCGLAIFWPHADLMPWWGALLIFFAPDLSFAGYAAGPRVGAFVYNSVHIYAFGAVFLALFFITSAPLLAVVGGLWLAHSGFDRLLGYGLKSPDGFAVTHLGQIGKPR